MSDNGKQPPDDPPDSPDDGAEVYDLSTQRGRRAKTKASRRRRQAARTKNKADHKAKQKAKPPRNNPDRLYIRCKGRTKLGSRCKSYAKTADGLCVRHSASEVEAKALMAQARAIRDQAKLKPHELMRAVVESNPIAFMQPYLDALGIKVVFVPDPADPRILHPTAVAASDGALLYGVSKDGDVVVSKHKDIEAQQRAAERLFDRIYGKPKQTNIIAGANTQDDPNLVPFDDKRQAEVAAILESAKRPSHAMPPNSQN
jgi:hypothetical protein